MALERSHASLSRFRPWMEQLEDRCVPAALSSTVPTGVPATLGKVIAVAQGEKHALIQSLGTLQQTASQLPASSFGASLVNQSIQLTQAEQAAMTRLISRLQHSKPAPAPAPAYVKVFALEVSIAKANTNLQTLQSQETVQGSLLPFSVPHF